MVLGTVQVPVLAASKAHIFMVKDDKNVNESLPVTTGVGMMFLWS